MQVIDPLQSYKLALLATDRQCADCVAALDGYRRFVFETLIPNDLPAPDWLSVDDHILVAEYQGVIFDFTNPDIVDYVTIANESDFYEHDNGCPQHIMDMIGNKQPIKSNYAFDQMYLM